MSLVLLIFSTLSPYTIIFLFPQPLIPHLAQGDKQLSEVSTGVTHNVLLQVSTKLWGRKVRRRERYNAEICKLAILFQYHRVHLYGMRCTRQVFLLISGALTSLVGQFDLCNLSSGTAAEDLNQDSLIRANSLHGLTETLGIIEDPGLHQSKDSALQVATEF